MQRAAEAVYSEAGQQQTRALVDLYMNNAKLIREGLQTVGLEVYGGINAPYVWVKTPDGLGSWDYFEKLLHDTKIGCTPGSGFGATGEGYVRMSAFNRIDRVAEAIDRVQKATTVKP